MIPPVERYTPEELEEEDAYRARPAWFKFFYGAWLLSTASMDDDQQGWYMRLLTWAASEGEPPGYLPDDEYELKQIAGFKDLNPGVAYILKHGVEVPEEVMKGLEAARELKWQKVRRKFRVSRSNPGCVYNKRLVSALEEAYRNNKLQVEHGRRGGAVTQAKLKEKRTLEAGAKEPGKAIKKSEHKQDSEVRKGNLQEERELEAPALPAGQEPALEGAKAINYLSLSLPSSEVKETTQEEEERFTLEVESMVGETREETSLTDMEKGAGDENEEQVNRGGSARSRPKRPPESIFDESKFRITGKMKAFVLTKHSELDEGDLEYMQEKFCNVYHGTRHSSWSRCFYNFVSNQLIKYNYVAGSYKAYKQRRGGTDKDVSQKPKPWDNQQRGASAAERNAALEREAEELSRQLRGRGSGHNPEDAPALSLAPDEH